MHQMKLTNRQITDILADVRKQLKNCKTTDGALSINFKLPQFSKDEIEKAKLVIKQKAWAKLIGLVNACDKEVAWHGTVIKEGNMYIITDVLVFPQTVTGATVTSDETEYSMWLMNQPDEVFNNIRFHGHSHVNMGVSPSGVDTDYQENILRNLQDFYIFAIFNKKGDYWCAIYDIESNICYRNEDIEVVTPNSEGQTWAEAAIKTYVKEPFRKPVAKKEKKDKKNNNLDKDYDNNPDKDYDYSTDLEDYFYSNGNYLDWRNRVYGQK